MWCACSDTKVGAKWTHVFDKLGTVLIMTLMFHFNSPTRRGLALVSNELFSVAMGSKRAVWCGQGSAAATSTGTQAIPGTRLA